MELHIDNRERELIPNFGAIKLNLSNLELGDIIIKYNGKIVAIFERKTLSDLAASIKDGRYHNQKKRLLENYDPRIIYYIIEGQLDFAEDIADVKINGISKNTLLSCVYNMSIRDHIQVFITSGLSNTVHLINGIFRRVSNNPEKYIGGADPEDASGGASCDSAAGSATSSNIQEQIIKTQVSTAEEFFLKMLYQVPGISLKTGTAIAEKYKTMVFLYESLSKHSNEEKLKTLKEISIKDIKGNSRRISETVAKNIIKFIF